jgi:ubiquitin-protein ligase E3 B
MKGLNVNPLFQSAHTFLMVLYRRDCRRSYTVDNHWLIKDLRVGAFITDLEKGKKTTQVCSLSNKAYGNEAHMLYT